MSKPTSVSFKHTFSHLLKLTKSYRWSQTLHTTAQSCYYLYHFYNHGAKKPSAKLTVSSRAACQFMSQYSPNAVFYRCARSSMGSLWVLPVVIMGPTSQMFSFGPSSSSSPPSSYPPSLSSLRQRDIFPLRWDDLSFICHVLSSYTIV